MSSTYRHQLGDFLRECREASAAPEHPSRRRTPGLRREEVAQAAFISTEYYTRIEQGRFIPSPDVLTQIANVLALNADQRQYLADLARAERASSVGLAQASGSGRADNLHVDVAKPTSRAHPGLERLIDGLGSIPALLIGAHTAIIGWNDAAARLFIDFSAVPEAKRTCAHLIFTNDDFQSRFVDVAGMREVIVAIWRAGSVSWDAEAEQRDLVDELRSLSADFAQRWDAHVVQQPHDSTPIALNHPDDGLRWADRVVLKNMDTPEVRVLFFNFREGH